MSRAGHVDRAHVATIPSSTHARCAPLGATREEHVQTELRGALELAGATMPPSTPLIPATLLRAERTETVRPEPFDAIEVSVGTLFGDDPRG